MTTTTEFNEADLPELPSTGDYQLSQAVPEDTPVWTAESVRTYALAAVAASRKKLMQQKPVFEVGFGWLDDATKYPRGTKLFAAPMPQTNESDAVAAPPCVLTYDEDTDAWDSACGEKLFFDEGGPAENGMRFCYACGKKITARAVLADEPLPQPDGPTQEQEAILQKLTDEAQAMGLYDAQPVQDEPCCANPCPDCMGMLLSGIGNRCAALAQAQASGQAARLLNLLREARATLEMWKDVAPAVSLCADIDALLDAAPTPPANAAPAIDRNAIIEECAKVAEGARDGSRSHLFRSAGTIIAGNIRALKDPENCNE